MSGPLFAVIVVAFVVVGVVIVRRTQRGAFVDRLPIEDGEQELLREERLKLWHRFQKRAVRDGGTTTYRVRSVLTDRRILLATGGPEGKHKFVLLMIVDYTNVAPPVPETGSGAYRRKFQLQNGYPTYACSAADVTVEQQGDEAQLRIVVPFPEGGERWGPPPELRLTTPNADRYAEAIKHASA
jgi:hypothetical protein